MSIARRALSTESGLNSSAQIGELTTRRAPDEHITSRDSEGGGVFIGADYDRAFSDRSPFRRPNRFKTMAPGLTPLRTHEVSVAAAAASVLRSGETLETVFDVL